MSRETQGRGGLINETGTNQYQSRGGVVDETGSATYTGAIAGTIGAATASLSATFTKPTYSGVVACTIGHATASLAAIFAAAGDTIVTVYSGTADGFVESSGTNYTTARAGPGTLFDDSSTTAQIGQFRSGTTRSIWEAFFTFDLLASGVGAGDTINSVMLALCPTADASDTDFTIEVRLYDWGASLTEADWVAGDDLASKTLLASLTTAGIATGGYVTITESGTALKDAAAAALVGSGKLRVVVVSSRTTAATAPADEVGEYINVSTSDEVGTGQDPKLIVSYTADVTYTGAIAGTIGRAVAVLSATFVKPIYSGTVAATIGRATCAASATFVKPTYSGVINTTRPAITTSLSGTFVKPIYSGAIGATVGRAVASAAATTSIGTRTGAATATVGPATASLAGTFVKPTRTGVIVATIGRVIAALSGHVPQDYYVSNAGSDSNNGTSTSTPWLTVAKVNAFTFGVGDRIFFKRGGRWREQLTVPLSGSAGAPITFGAYDSGANPIIDGSDVISSWTPAMQITDNGAIFTATGSDEDGGLGVTRNMRWVVPAASISANASEITVTFKGASGGSGAITAAAIGERSGSTNNFTGTPTRLTFSGGANGISVPFDTEVTTDAITFALDETKTYLVSVWTTNRSINYKTGGASGPQMYFKADGSDESQTTTVTGYDASFVSYTGVRRMNSVTSAPIANVYQAPGVGSNPGVLYRNGVRQSMAADVASLNSTNTWTYASGLYVYSTTDPATDGSTWEAPQRTYATLALSKNYLNFDDIDFRMGKTFGLELSGCNTVNTNRINAYQNASSGISIEQACATVTITGGSIHHNGGVVGGDSNGIGTGGLGAASSPIVIDGVAIYDNVNDNIEVFGPPTGGTTNITIRNCPIYGTLSTGTGGGIRFSGDGTIVSLIEHSLVYRTRDHGIVANMAPGGSLTVNYYHNVLALNRASGLYAVHGTWVGKNNIFYENDQAALGWPEVALEATVTSYTENYNLVYHSAGGTFMTWTDGVARNWANWKTTSGQDANSVNADPLFVNVGTNDYHLQAGSPAINAGVAIAGINDGYIGAAPDIGAFEASAAYTGTIAAAIGRATASLAATFVKPTYSGAVAATIGHATCTAAATFTKPTYTVVVAATVGHATTSLIGTFVKPTRTGTISGTVGHAVASVAATFVKPTYSGAITGTIGHVVASLSAATAATHPVGLFTQPRYGLSGRRYGSFAGKRATYTSAVSVSIGSISASLVGTFTKPTYAGTIASSVGHIVGSLAGTFVKPTYTATVLATVGHVTSALSAAFTKPTYSGNLAATVPHATAVVAVTFTKPVYAATVVVTIGHATSVLSGTFVVYTYAGTIAAAVGRAVGSVVGLHVKPIYTGPILAFLAPVTVSVSATYLKPTYHASIAATVGHATTALSGTFYVYTYTGTIAAAVRRPIASGSASHTVAVYTATIMVAAPHATADASGLFGYVIFLASGSVQSGAILCSANATQTFPARTAAGAVQVGATTASVAGGHTIPTYTGSVLGFIGRAEAFGTATFVVPTYVGVVVALVGPATASSAATFVQPAYTVAGEVLVGGVTASASATSGNPIYTAVGTLTVGPVTASLLGIYGASVSLGVISVTVGAVQIAGTAYVVEPGLPPIDLVGVRVRGPLSSIPIVRGPLNWVGAET